MKDDKNLLGLATVRRNRGISLQQISDNTKISVRSLEAIERGDFQKLPGGIYTTSYIRQYASAIDYDAALIIAAYQRKMSSAETARAANEAKGYRGFTTASSPVGT